MIKHLLDTALKTRGYTIVKSAKFPPIEFVRFESLCHAYERDCGKNFPKNPLRSRLLGSLLGTAPSEGYAIIEALQRTSDIDGDVCEFGVAQGKTSALIANEIRDGPKILHLFDSFQGLPAPTEKDVLRDDIFDLGKMEAYAGTMREPMTKVVNELRAIDFPEDRYAIHGGFFDHILKTDKRLPRRVSFAYVDFDLYEPIRQVLEFLSNGVLTNGGIVLVDDYNWFSAGAKTAVDEFVAVHSQYNVKIFDADHDHFAVLKRLESPRG